VTCGGERGRLAAERQLINSEVVNSVKRHNGIIWTAVKPTIKTRQLRQKLGKYLA